MMKEMKAAIFDMDGTLVDSLMFWDSFWEKLGCQLLGVQGFRPPEQVDKNVRTMLVTDAMIYVNRECALGLDEDVLLQFVEDSMRGFYREEVDLKPGVLQYLEYLEKQNVKMCIASATALKYIKEAVECLGISQYFSAVLSCEEVGKGKDQPDIYLKAMECLDAKPEDSWVYEDSFVALETAKKIGLHTVGVFDVHNYGHDRLQAAAEIYLDEGMSMADLIV